MDTKHLNELFAVRVMGLVPGVDFGEFPEHEWRRKRDGEIDKWAATEGYHNGPRCSRCGYAYCVHCDESPTEPCVKEVPDYIQPYRLSQITTKLAELVPSGSLRIDFIHHRVGSGGFIKVSLSTGTKTYEAEADRAELAVVMAALRWEGVID